MREGAVYVASVDNNDEDQAVGGGRWRRGAGGAGKVDLDGEAER